MFARPARSLSRRPSRVSVADRLPAGPLTLAAQAETARGYVYVAGRLAGVVEKWQIVWNRVSFATIPSTIDAFLAGYGGVSHVALVWQSTTYVFRATGGSLREGYALIEVPSQLEIPSPECPGLRLPTT